MFKRTLFLSIAGFILLILCISSVAEAAWYNAAWKYRKKITIDYTKVSGGANLSYFPMLFTMTDWNLKTIANGGYMGNSGGTDIVFTSSDEITKIPHEIEKFTDSTGELIAWVRIPTLSYTANTVIYMYYGNAGVADQQNKTGVWDDGEKNYYKGVWHMGEGDSTATDFYKDSTSNANHGTLTDADGDSEAATGKIDGAVDFNGDADFVNTGTKDSIDNLPAADFTAQAWFKIDTFGDNSFGRVFMKDAYSNGWLLYVANNSSQQSIRFGQYFSDGLQVWEAPANSVLTENWYQFSVVYNGSNVNNDPIFYLNDNTVTATVGTRRTGNKLSDATYDLLIGDQADGARSFNGIIDEARVSSTARSAGWIKTEYNNQSSPLTFYSVGDTAGVTWTQGESSPSWQPRSGYGCVVFNNKVWIIGGYYYNGSSWVRMNDVWYSDNPGVQTSWTQATAGAGWSVRNVMGCLVYDNKMWVIRGNCCKSDVWYSTDGANWTQATSDAGIGGGHNIKNVLVFQNKMWIIAKSHQTNQVWYSTNGVNWTQASTPPWPGRNDANCLVYDNKMWLIGGNRNQITPWQSSETGTLSTDNSYDYSMGYKFTPTIEGRVTRLYGYFNGTKTVKLYNSSYTLLASASVTSSNAWAYTNITPVNVEPNSVYYVVVEGAGSGGAIRTSATIPATTDFVTINASVYQSPSGTFNASHTETTASMYGLVDILIDAERLRDDVWYSSDGNNWTQATSQASYGLRRTFGCVVFDNKMWVIGGVLPSPDCRRKDVWWSTDGANWIRATTAAWSNARAIDVCIVYKNRIWNLTNCVADRIYYSNSDYWNP